MMSEGGDVSSVDKEKEYPDYKNHKAHYDSVDNNFGLSPKEAFDVITTTLPATQGLIETKYHGLTEEQAEQLRNQSVQDLLKQMGAAYFLKDGLTKLKGIYK